jgi:hypothetical protein
MTLFIRQNDIKEIVMTEAANIFYYQPTPEEITEAFRSDLNELEETAVELAKRMQDMGDHRSFQAILRSIQRMAAGDTGVSGEMRVIVRALLRQQRRREKKYAGIQWQRQNNGTVSSVVDDFTIDLYPKSKGRWLVHLVHIPTKYSPSWPAWQDNLEAAKRKALTCLDDAYIQLDELERQHEAA